MLCSRNLRYGAFYNSSLHRGWAGARRHGRWVLEGASGPGGAAHAQRGRRLICTRLVGILEWICWLGWPAAGGHTGALVERRPMATAEKQTSTSYLSGRRAVSVAPRHPFQDKGGVYVDEELCTVVLQFGEL